MSRGLQLLGSRFTGSVSGFWLRFNGVEPNATNNKHNAHFLPGLKHPARRGAPCRRCGPALLTLSFIMESWDILSPRGSGTSSTPISLAL